VEQRGEIHPDVLSRRIGKDILPKLPPADEKGMARI
jgi:hypothetical protein